MLSLFILFWRKGKGNPFGLKDRQKWHIRSQGAFRRVLSGRKSHRSGVIRLLKLTLEERGTGSF
jgi:hypothetical protein